MVSRFSATKLLSMHKRSTRKARYKAQSSRGSIGPRGAEHTAAGAAMGAAAGVARFSSASAAERDALS
jgi:hypothetical protein